MKRWIYWKKLNNWASEGYDVSILKEKHFDGPPPFPRWLLLILVLIVLVPLSIWTIVTIIPREPAVITFVVDTSTSMNGARLENVKEGLEKALNSMNKQSQAGVIFFNDTVHDEIPVGPINNTLAELKYVVDGIYAHGGAFLYGAIEAGIKMTDAVVSNVGKIRAVIVITDSQHNGSRATVLHDIINMRSLAGYNIQQFEGLPGQLSGIDEMGRSVPKEEIIGDSLAIETDHPVQIHFIAIGDEPDLEIARMLAAATNGSFKRISENDIKLKW
ncbi:MAG TPA: VWA domain-containing protein [Dehalococcoidia bacterium]|nr:VWA domain-containing protein [Dehalococcoidia bacterium]